MFALACPAWNATRWPSTMKRERLGFGTILLLGFLLLFFTAFLLFARFVPMIAMAEVKSLLRHQPRTGRAR